ncbi:MAG TPA: nucleotide exchange factor GrpE [bacterium]|nr:nucleotide exchange factor GrpE [bacterium]
MKKSANHKEQEDNQVEAEIVENTAIDYQEKYQRALADYQNLLRQTAKDKSDIIRYGNEKLLNELLPVYDFLKISLAHSAENDPLASGLKYVLQEFKKVLTNASVEEIVTKDQMFDFNAMEAVETVETEDETKNDKVAKELQSGYMIYDKVVRPARVAVYKLINQDSEAKN